MAATRTFRFVSFCLLFWSWAPGSCVGGARVVVVILLLLVVVAAAFLTRVGLETRR